MDRFLRFLVQGMNSVDGRNGTADFFIDSATTYEIEKQEKRMNRKIMKKRESIPLADDEEYDDSLQIKVLTQEERD